MATQDIISNLKLKAEVEGGKEYLALAEALDDIAKEAGEAQPELQRLAKELRELGSQADAAAGFEAAQRAVLEYTRELNKATKELEAVAAEQQKAAAAAQAASDAQAAASAKLAESQTRHQALQKEVQQTTAALDALKHASAASMDSTLSKAVQEQTTKLAELRKEAKESGEEFQRLKEASKGSTDPELARALQQQEQELKKLQQAAKDSAAKLKELREAQKQSADPGLAKAMQEQSDKLDSLRKAAKESASEVKRLKTEQQAASAIQRETAKTAQDAARAYDQQVKSAGQISKALGEQRAALQGAQQAMQTAGNSSQRLAETQQRAADALKLMGGESKKAQKDLKDVAAAADKGDDAFKKLATAMAGIFALNKMQAFAADTIKLADAYKQMAEGVKMATPAAAEFDLVQQRLLETANRTYRAMTEQQQLYINTADALRSYGYETSQVLDIQDSFSYLLTTNAASAEKAASAIDAYTKSIQSGKVGAQAWASIMAAMPTVVDALATSLGITTKEVRQLGVTGKLEIGKLNEALRVTREENGRLADEMSVSVGDAITKLKNTWFAYIGETNEAHKVTEKIAGLIDSLAKNLDVLIEVATAAGATIATVFAIKTIIALRNYVGELAKATAATVGLGKASTATAAQVTAVGAAAQKTNILFRQFNGTLGVVGATLATIGWGLVIQQLADLIPKLIELRKLNIGIAESQKRTADTAQEVARRLADISRETGVTVTSMAELNEAVADGRLEWDAASKTYVAAGQALASIGEGAKQAAQDLESLSAAKVIEEFSKIKDAAKDVGKAIGEAFEKAGVDVTREAGVITKALSSMLQAGIITATEFRAAWEKAVSAMSGAQMKNALAEIKKALDETTMSAADFARVNDVILRESFKRLGVDASLALGTINDETNEAIDVLGVLEEALRNAGKSGKEFGQAMEMAMEKAIPTATSLEALDKMGQHVAKLGREGKISAEGMARMNDALDKQRAAIEDALPGIQSMTEALRMLGVKPQAELERLAEKSREAFEYIKNSGTATPREINQAWKKMAEAAIEANDGMADSTIKAQAAAHGFAIQVDESGQASVRRLGDVAKSARDAGKAMGEAGDEGQDAFGRIAFSADEALNRLKNSGFSVKSYWYDAEIAASKYFEQVQKIAEQVEREMIQGGAWRLSWGVREAMQQAARHYIAAMESMEAAAEKLKRAQSGTANEIADLELRLIELNGTEEEIAAARAQRDRKEVQIKLELARIELERAQLQKDPEAIELQKQEIANLQRVLQLTEQIAREEKRQRAEKKREESTPAPAPAPTRSAPAAPAPAQSGGGMASSAPPVTINFNANGINDPVKLAKQLEPELKRLGLLNR